MSAPVRIPVGVVVARRKAASPWIDFTFAPVAVLDGAPQTEPWTVLRLEGDTTLFYAGSAEVALHPSETARYRDNLATGAPSLWVVLAEQEGEQPYQVAAVTADPSEGESYTAGAAYLVDHVPMPQAIRELVAAFIAAHHVERQFFKRKRDRADPESLARRRGYGDHGE
jgi:hypothetical protein